MKVIACTLVLSLFIPALANASNIIRVMAPVQHTDGNSAGNSGSGGEPALPSATLSLLDATLTASRVGEDYLFNFSPYAQWSNVQANSAPQAPLWTASAGMPSGLTLSPEGLLSGFPMVSGTHSIEVKATSGTQTALKTYSLTVDPAITVSVNQAVLPVATIGQAFNYDFNNHLAWQGLRAGESAPAVTWTPNGALPSGLSLSASGILSGSPEQSGTLTLNVGVTGSGYTASNQFSLVVQQPADAVVARYFRINITANNGDDYTAIQEIEMRSVAGGMDITTPTTVATNSSNHPNNTAAKTVDNNFTTYDGGGWVSPYRQAYPHILTYDLGSVKSVKEIAAWPQAWGYGPSRGMKNFSIEYSNDGVNWALAKSFSNITGWTVGAPKVFQLK